MALDQQQLSPAGSKAFPYINSTEKINKTSRVSLSKEEKQWLEQNPTIKIAVMSYWTHDKQGNNIHTEILKLLNTYGGINLIPIKFDAWKDGYTEATNGEFIQGIMNLSWTKEREDNYFNYTEAYNYKPSYLIVRDTNTNIYDLEDLNNKSIYLKEKSIDHKTVEDASLNTKIIPMQTDEMMYQNLSTKTEADAFISYAVDKEKLKQYNLKVVKVIYNKYGEVYLGINYKYKYLHSIINKIYKVIPKNELSNLRNTVYEHKNKIGIDLSQDEEYWLKNNSTIKIAVMDYWKVDDEGNSIHTDILKLLNKYGGINLIPIKFNAWKNGYNEAISGKLIQGIMNLSWSQERENKYFNYTKAYNYKPAYLVIRNDNRKIQSLQDLDQKTIFLKEKSVIYNTIDDASIDTKIIAMKTDEMMYKGLTSNKEVDAFISSTINKEKLKQYNLKIAQTIHDKYGEVSLGLNHKYPQLQSIIDKIYQIIPKSELLNLRNKVYESVEKVDLKLTDEEKQWIKTHTVTVGVEQWAPILFSNDGSDIDGIAGDFTKKIIERSGLKIKVVTGTWNKLLEDFKNKKIDLLPATYFTQDRSEYGLYGFDYFKIKDALYVTKANQSIKSMKSLKGRTLAIVKDTASIEKISKNFPDIKILETKTLNDSIQKVLDGSADALFEGQLAVEKKLQDELITGLKAISQNNFKASFVHYFSKIDEPLLQSILQKGLQSISYLDRQKIISKWVDTDNELKLEEKEQNWLDKNIPIRYVYDPDWAPFEWKNELEIHSGILSDILNLISSKSGMELIPVPVNTWSEAVQKAKKREVDMYSGVGRTDDKLKYMNFTQKSIYQTPYVFVSRLDDTSDYFDTFNALSNKKVAVVDGYTIHEILKKEQPKLSLVSLNSVKDGFEKLKDKSIDIFIVNAATAKYYISKRGYDTLRIASKTQYNFDLKIALRNDWPKEVISIMDKSINTITPKELSDIYNKWTEITIQEKIDWTLILQIAAIGFVIISFVVYNNRKLTRVVSEKTSELTTLLKSFDENVIASKTDLEGNITYASQAFCEISEYTQEELLGQPQNIVRHPDMSKEIFNDLWQTIKTGKVWRGEVKNKKKYGGFYWATVMIEPIFNSNKICIGYSAIRQDITPRKEVENLSINLEHKVKEKTKDLNEQLEIVIASEKKQNELFGEVENAKQEIELILSNVLLPLLITSKKDRIILYANSFAEVQYKIPLDKIIGSNIDDLYTAQDQKEHLIELLQTTGRVENLEQVFKRANGEEFTALLSVTPIIYKGEESYIGMVTDITKQKEQEEVVRKLHKHTQDSIEYASLIQSSLIPEHNDIQEYFNEYFSIWQPKDTVGGDIYLFEELRNKDECLLMVIDCTGHGVPGAFVTMLVKAIERQIIGDILASNEEVSPSKILSYFNQTMKKILKQETVDSISNAGFDGGIFYYNKKENYIKYAGAETPLFYVQDNELNILKGNRHSVGYKKCDPNYVYTEYHIDIDKETTFYISTDGYFDQNGGNKGFPYSKKRFKEFLQNNMKASLADQEELLLSNIQQYMGEEEKNDDITVIGLKLSA